MLSIIIPTLNEEGYLPLLLESIKKQNFNEDYEIIVADADSKDKTIEIARTYGCKVTAGGSPSKGRNEGAKAASGDLFLFLDADTILPENFLEKGLKEFKEEKIDIATCPIKSVSGEKFLNFLYYLFYNLPIIIFGKFLPHASNFILVKKEIHQKIGGFDEEIKIAEDHIYAREGAKFGKFGILKKDTLLVSPRRFKEEGWVKVYLKYVLVGIYVFFLGPVKSDIFKYRFNHKLKKLKK